MPRAYRPVSLRTFEAMRHVHETIGASLDRIPVRVRSGRPVGLCHGRRVANRCAVVYAGVLRPPRGTVGVDWPANRKEPQCHSSYPADWSSSL